MKLLIRSILQTALSIVVTLAVLLWCGLCIIFASITILATRSRKIAYWTAKKVWAPFLLKICRIELHVKGIQNLQSVKQPVIFIMNHQSYLDIPVAYAALQSDLHFIGKQELRFVPFIGWYMKLAGMIFINRKNGPEAIASMKKAGNLIRQGNTVLAFPEGTRSKNGQIGPFKKGIFITAIEAQVPLVPVAIQGANNCLPTKKLLIRPGKIQISIGHPIEMSKSALGEKDQILESSRNQMIELYSNLYE